MNRTFRRNGQTYRYCSICSQPQLLSAGFHRNGAGYHSWWVQGLQKGARPRASPPEQDEDQPEMKTEEL